MVLCECETVRRGTIKVNNRRTVENIEDRRGDWPSRAKRSKQSQEPMGVKGER